MLLIKRSQSERLELRKQLNILRCLVEGTKRLADGRAPMGEMLRTRPIFCEIAFHMATNEQREAMLKISSEDDLQIWLGLMQEAKQERESAEAGTAPAGEFKE
jgi:hypothetical protein